MRFIKYFVSVSPSKAESECCFAAAGQDMGSINDLISNWQVHIVMPMYPYSSV